MSFAQPLVKPPPWKPVDDWETSSRLAWGAPYIIDAQTNPEQRKISARTIASE